MKNGIPPKIMTIKPNLSLKMSYNYVRRNFQDEVVSRIGVLVWQLEDAFYYPPSLEKASLPKWSPGGLIRGFTVYCEVYVADTFLLHIVKP